MDTARRRALVAASILGLGSTPVSAQATDAVAGAAPVADGGAAAPADDITVTARKRSERLVEVPEAITVFDATTIERSGIESVNDVALRMPNLSIVEAQQPGVAAITIRGVSQVRNAEAPVAVVIDGVQLFSSNQITQDLFDIERIEVLKGPQGSTYGRNAIGGAINIVTRKPTNAFEGWAQGSYGTGDNWMGSAALSGPVVDDKLLFRVAVSVRDMAGDITNATLQRPVNFEETRNARLRLLARPLERIEVDLQYARSDTSAGAAWYTLVPPGTSINAVLPVTADRLGESRRVLDDASVKVDVAFENALLTSISAYSKVFSDIDQDFDYTALDLLSATQTLSTRAWSQELRIASDGLSPFNWLVGAYFLATDQSLDSRIFLRPGASGVLAPFPIPAPILFSATGSTDDNKAYALFGQISYRFSNGIEASLGLRQDWDERNQLDRISGQRFSRTFASFQPKLQLSYHPDRDATLYTSVAKGFRSGGFNPNARITRVFDQEENWNYEVGAKANLFGKNLSVEAAAFVTDVNDRQVYIFDQLTAAQTIANPIPKARIRGLELDARFRPADGLEVGGSLGLLDTEITRYDTGVFAGLPAEGDFTGNRLPQTAHLSYGFNVQYAHRLDDRTTFTGRAELNSSGGDFFWEIDNLDRRERIDLVNLRLIGEHEGLRVTAFVDNLLQERFVLEYISQRFSGAPLGNYSIPAPGRRWGLQARYQF